MNYWIALGCAFVSSLGLCRILLFRKKFPRESILWGLLLMFLPLFLPYRLIEKTLLECGGGTAWAFLSNYSTNFVEMLAFFLVLLLLKNQNPELFAHKQDVFTLSFFFGLHLGWGKALRDSLLAFFHHFSPYYGYSQFMIFPSFFYLVLKIMEVIFEAQVGALLGIALFFPGVPSLRLPLLLFLLVFKGIPGFMETAIQFIPRFRFFSSLYPISLLPLTIILGFVVMQRLLQRKEEEKP